MRLLPRVHSETIPFWHPPHIMGWLIWQYTTQHKTHHDLHHVVRTINLRSSSNCVTLYADRVLRGCEFQFKPIDMDFSSLRTYSVLQYICVGAPLLVRVIPLCVQCASAASYSWWGLIESDLHASDAHCSGIGFLHWRTCSPPTKIIHFIYYNEMVVRASEPASPPYIHIVRICVQTFTGKYKQQSRGCLNLFVRSHQQRTH